MQKYINNIELLIERQIIKNKGTTVIRLDGINNPIIYKTICQYFEFNSKINLNAKLSKNKYEYFKSLNSGEWNLALEYLENNNFIDKEDTMTKWRNSSVEIEGSNNLLLMMGTEVVDDKGGLEDFYCITPETIIAIVKKDFSAWFSDIVEVGNFNKPNKIAINTFFKKLFSNVNIDLVNLSNLVEELEILNINTVNEIFVETCNRLSKYWDIPNILDEKKIPKLASLKDGKTSKAEIIEKSFTFINRIKFNKGITKAALNSFEKKIDKYKEKENIDENSRFPYDSLTFENYNEFKIELLEFIKGKNYLDLREKFLNVDYALIDKIIAVRLEPGTPKEKVEKVYGEPLEVYSQLILRTVNEFKKENKYMPTLVEIKINELKITNCSTDEEARKSFETISNNLGGIVDFINNSNNFGIYPKFTYENEIDPFKDNDSNLNIIKSASIGELSKIKYTICAYGENKENIKEKITSEFEYRFKITDDWMMNFKFIQETYEDLHHENIKLPFYVYSDKLEEYITCESDEAFFTKIAKDNFITISDEYDSNVFSINHSEIDSAYGFLKEIYRAFFKTLNEKGFYDTLINNNECKKVFERYSNLMECICDNFNNMTSYQKEKLEFLSNMFVIGDKKYDDFIRGKNEIVLLAPHHPVMLEKIYYRAEYIKQGFYEILNLINIESVVTEKSLDKKINYLFKMCFINNGFDLYFFKNFSDSVLGKGFGKYSLYVTTGRTINSIYCENFDSKALTLEDVDIKSIIKKSHKSDIISQNILDYLKTFPSRIDGLNILFVNPDDMQHIISGIDSVVNISSELYLKIILKIKIIVANNRRKSISYLKSWLNNYLEKKSNISIKVSIKYFDFEADKPIKDFEDEFESQDLVYMYSILENENIRLVKGNTNDIIPTSKYPVLYNPMPVSISQQHRAIDISQKQFISSKNHLQLVHKLANPNGQEGYYKVIKRMLVSDRKKELINLIHKKSRWVVCLDEAIDKNIINNNDSKVIGFSTGKGIFGELNTTVSAREDIVIDIQYKLQKRLMAKFTKWMPEIAEKVAKNCIELSKNLDGSKMLKALNPNDYEIHNYLAYILTMKILKIDNIGDETIIKVLINLDNYLHWFDQDMCSDYMKETKTRPDFLVLEVCKTDNLKNNNDPLKIKATVIECKMGKYNEQQIENAKLQVFEGLKTLSRNFSNINKTSRSKYWFNQLYRSLVFSKLNTTDNSEEYKVIAEKLEKIIDGEFEIEWSTNIYAYWIDGHNEDIITNNTLEEFKEKILDDNIILKNATINEVGQINIQKILLDNQFENVDITYNEQEDEVEEISLDLIKNANVNEKDINNEKNNLYNDLDIFSEEKIEVTEINVEKDVEINIEKDTEINIEKDTEINIEKQDEKVIVTDLKNSNQDIKIQDNKDIDVRILLGEDARTKEKIYWEYTNKELNNRHLLINGNSGSGKTYCIQTLILEAAKNNISVIVFDYTEGFTKQKLSPHLINKLGDNFEERMVKYEKFPVNPFRKGQIILPNGKEVDELDEDVANRIADSFSNVYKFKEQQRSSIYSSVRSCLKKYKSSTTLENLREELKECENKSATTVLSKVEALVDYNPFLSDSDFSWKDIIEAKGQMYVIQLSGYTREIQVILTELILWDIWNYAVKNGNEKTPIPIVLDEAQNLPHGENSPSGKMLTEGRKFGISGWYATQFMSGKLNSAEIGNLQQAAQKLYFSPPESCIMEVAKYIDISNDGSKLWAEKLSKLVKGECVTNGFMISKNGKFGKYEPKIIKITSLEERTHE